MRVKAVATILMLLVLGAACSASKADAQGIEALGTGTAPVTYDELEFDLHLEYRADTEAKASAGADRAMTAVAAAFTDSGLAEARTIGTATASSVANVTYKAGTSRATVRVRDLSKATEVVNRAIAAGKKSEAVLRWTNVKLHATDLVSERRTAREVALSDARRRAAELARASDRSLGKVLAITTVSEPSPPPLGYPISLLVERDLPKLDQFIRESTSREGVFVNLKVRYEIK